jgi:membrane-associated phospholipid phosphatase
MSTESPVTNELIHTTASNGDLMLLATIALAVADLVWGGLKHWTFAFRELLGPAVIVAIFLCPLIFPRYRREIKLSTACKTAALFQAFAVPAGIFSYLVVSTNAPLIDDLLDGWDKAIGFDWPSLFLWDLRHPWIDQALTFAYASVPIQALLVVIYLSFADRRAQLKDFTSAFTISAVFTLIVAGFYPASAASLRYQSLVHSNVSMLSDFYLLRDGSLKAIHLSRLQGLISMPSFHTITAVLLTYAMRGTRVFIPFAMLNLVVIFSTLIQGGHYLVDVLGGLITVAAAIWFARSNALARLLRKSEGSSASVLDDRRATIGS